MQIALTIVQIIITVALIILVLMQSGKTQGLSGSIAGGAETFFGKNKGRTLDGILSKITSVLVVLFIISSIALSIVMMK
ncbi:MAG: preprotein translocase subunit SecG [Clostridia bacterium]|nr:preprotein translocase subunit SecG [Clostridia bacterium]